MTGAWAQRWRDPDKLVPAIAALIVNAALGYMLILGLRGAPLLNAVVENTPLALFDLKPPKPEEPKPPPLRRPDRDEAKGGAPPPAGPRQEPAPPPPARPAATTSPSPIVLAPAPVAAPTTASTMAGTDTGGGADGGGSGEGLGDGGSGAGRGRGEGDGGSFSRARQTDGRFRNSDFPDALRGVGRLRIGVRYAIGPTGRVDNCEIIEGSGYPEVDAMTCRIIVERYRFRPARDPEGYAVTEVREEDYRWRVR